MGTADERDDRSLRAVDLLDQILGLDLRLAEGRLGLGGDCGEACESRLVGVVVGRGRVRVVHCAQRSSAHSSAEKTLKPAISRIAIPTETIDQSRMVRHSEATRRGLDKRWAGMVQAGYAEAVDRLRLARAERLRRGLGLAGRGRGRARRRRAGGHRLRETGMLGDKGALRLGIDGDGHEAARSDNRVLSAH